MDIKGIFFARRNKVILAGKLYINIKESFAAVYNPANNTEMIGFISIVAAIIFFGLIIAIHELGHYCAARLSKISVKEFAIGMGPVIFKKQGENSLFTLRLLPIGGFCAMDEDIENDEPDSFRKKPVLSRIFVMAAGAALNLVFGFLLSMIISGIIAGQGGYVGTTVISPESDAASIAALGLRPGDEIYKINNFRTYTVGDIRYRLTGLENGTADITVIRNGDKTELKGVEFETDTDPETGEKYLNYGFRLASEKMTAANFIPHSFKNAVYYGRIVIMSLADLIRGKYGLNSLQGPVGIVSSIGEIVKAEQGVDMVFLLEMATLITINIGIFNLLPIPALDGGKIVFLIIEIIRRKQLKAEVEGMTHFVGFALLMLLMVIVTFNDIRALFIRK